MAFLFGGGMAGRKKKLTVDYFPHFVEQGKTVFTIERLFGNDGYSVTFKTLELLAGSESHVYDFSEDEDFIFMCAKFNSDPEIVKPILDMLAKLKFIDPELYRNNVLWCDKLVENLAQVYEKRESELPLKPIPAPEISISDPEITQSKVKKSKVDKNNYSQNSDEFRLSRLLFDLILKRNSKHKKPDLQKWSEHIDKLIRINKRTADEIEKVIKWAQSDEFWQNNILSTKKLRDQFDQLILKMDGNGNGSSQGGKTCGECFSFVTCHDLRSISSSDTAPEKCFCYPDNARR